MVKLVIIKGAGDLASGVAHRLRRAGFRVIMTELPQPTVIRRPVAFAEAVYNGRVEVEGVTGELATDADEALDVSARGKVAVVVDPEAGIVRRLRPAVVVDAIMAKKNLGTTLTEAPVVIGLGPGFVAGRDVHAVVETQRGHYLGRVILEGTALPDSGVPGEVAGVAAERVLRAPTGGMFKGVKAIGDLVRAGEVVALVHDNPIHSAISGVLRGLLHDGIQVSASMKVGDVDPRGVRDYCFTISDKARAVGGGVLEAVCYLLANS